MVIFDWRGLWTIAKKDAEIRPHPADCKNGKHQFFDRGRGCIRVVFFEPRKASEIQALSLQLLSPI